MKIEFTAGKYFYSTRDTWLVMMEGVVVSVCVVGVVGEDGPGGVMLGMGGLADPADDSVEPVVVVSGVVHLTDGSVGLVEAVGSLDHVAVSGFRLVLHVAGVLIVDSIFEVVVRMSLREKSDMRRVLGGTYTKDQLRMLT